MINTRNFDKFSKLLMILCAVIFIGLFSCGNDQESSGDEWTYLGEVRDEKGKYVSVYIDLKNMEIKDKIRTFWIRYYAPINDGETEERYIRQLGLWEVDCQDRKLYVLKEKYYGPNGQVLGRSDKKIKEEYDENSIGNKMSAAACRYAGRN